MNIKVSYLTFMKHAKKVTKPKRLESRPHLKTVYHSGEHIAVTDSHRLYIAEGLYQGEEKLVEADTGQEVRIKGDYPDVKRLIPDSVQAKAIYTLEVNKVYEMVRAMEIADRVGNRRGHVEIEAREDGVEFRLANSSGMTISLKAGEDLEESKYLDLVACDIKYFKEALHVLKDAKVDYFSLEVHGAVRPLVITSGNFRAIVLPVRVV